MVETQDVEKHKKIKIQDSLLKPDENLDPGNSVINIMFMLDLSYK